MQGVSASILFTDSQLKMTNCLHYTEHRKAAEHLATCYPHALRLPSLSQYRSLCQKWELFFIKYGVKVNGLRYLINTLLSQQTLDAIKHVVDNSIVFQQDNAPVCVTSRGSITLGCAAIATSANSKLSVGQSACDVYATIVWLCGSCDVAIVWNFGSWTLTVVICK